MICEYLQCAYENAICFVHKRDKLCIIKHKYTLFLYLYGEMHLSLFVGVKLGRTFRGKERWREQPSQSLRDSSPRGRAECCALYLCFAKKPLPKGEARVVLFVFVLPKTHLSQEGEANALLFSLVQNSYANYDL